MMKIIPDVVTLLQQIQLAVWVEASQFHYLTFEIKGVKV